jgi:hypothetical protein
MVKHEHNPERFSRAQAPEKSTPSGIELLAQRVVGNGAIMTLPGCPILRSLVGHFVWLDPQRVFWFTAYGDTVADGHLLEFETTRASSAGVYFLNKGQVAACLTNIDEAGVDDPDDYRIAWQLWQEVAPLRSGLIEEACAQLTGEPWRSLGAGQVRIALPSQTRVVAKV